MNITKESININVPGVQIAKENVNVNTGATALNSKEDVSIQTSQEQITTKDGTSISLGANPLNAKSEIDMSISTENIYKKSPPVTLGEPVPVK